MYAILPSITCILLSRLLYTLALPKWWQSQGRTSPPANSLRSKNGISNHMLQAGGPQFQKTLCLLIKIIWEVEIYQYDWSKALVQPIYKGDAKPRVDLASYRGIYLTCMTTKLFEGILNQRLTEFTTRHESLTPFQFGSKKGFQTHDAIYTMLATIRNNQQFDQSPTYCAFIDFSTAYPSVHRNRLSSILRDHNIQGKMWMLLTGTYHLVQVRVLHPLLGPNRFTPIQRGLPEGSRLSPILFGIFMSELLRQLQKDFPHACTYTSKGNIWLGAITYVDDLVLISKSPHELQAMLNTCQSWCEKSRVEINLENTKIMIFNSRLQQTSRQPSHTWSITAQYLPRDPPKRQQLLK